MSNASPKMKTTQRSKFRLPVINLKGFQITTPSMKKGKHFADMENPASTCKNNKQSKFIFNEEQPTCSLPINAQLPSVQEVPIGKVAQDSLVVANFKKLFNSRIKLSGRGAFKNAIEVQSSGSQRHNDLENGTDLRNVMPCQPEPENTLSSSVFSRTVLAHARHMRNKSQNYKDTMDLS